MWEYDHGFSILLWGARQRHNLFVFFSYVQHPRLSWSQQLSWPKLEHGLHIFFWSMFALCGAILVGYVLSVLQEYFEPGSYVTPLDMHHWFLDKAELFQEAASQPLRLHKLVIIPRFRYFLSRYPICYSPTSFLWCTLPAKRLGIPPCNKFGVFWLENSCRPPALCSTTIPIMAMLGAFSTAATCMWLIRPSLAQSEWL